MWRKECPKLRTRDDRQAAGQDQLGLRRLADRCRNECLGRAVGWEPAVVAERDEHLAVAATERCHRGGEHAHARQAACERQREVGVLGDLRLEQLRRRVLPDELVAPPSDLDRAKLRVVKRRPVAEECTFGQVIIAPPAKTSNLSETSLESSGNGDGLHTGQEIRREMCREIC